MLKRKVCESCGHANASSKKFCGYCGKSLIEAAPGEKPGVAILDVPAIRAKMDRDAMRSSALSHQRGRDGFGFVSQPDLPQRRYVIDVHAEAGGHQGAPRERTAKIRTMTKD